MESYAPPPSAEDAAAPDAETSRDELKDPFGSSATASPSDILGGKAS